MFYSLSKGIGKKKKTCINKFLSFEVIYKGLTPSPHCAIEIHALFSIIAGHQYLIQVK